MSKLRAKLEKWARWNTGGKLAMLDLVWPVIEAALIDDKLPRNNELIAALAELERAL